MKGSIDLTDNRDFSIDKISATSQANSIATGRKSIKAKRDRYDKYPFNDYSELLFSISNSSNARNTLNWTIIENNEDNNARSDEFINSSSFQWMMNTNDIINRATALYIDYGGSFRERRIVLSWNENNSLYDAPKYRGTLELLIAGIKTYDTYLHPRYNSNNRTLKLLTSVYDYNNHFNALNHGTKSIKKLPKKMIRDKFMFGRDLEYYRCGTRTILWTTKTYRKPFMKKAMWVVEDDSVMGIE